MNKTKYFILFIVFLSICCFIIQTKTCDHEDQSLQCLILKDYPNLNDEMACQLCAVVLELGYQKYQAKADQFCYQKTKQNVRNCGLTSFAYLVQKGNIIKAYQTEYQAFYSDPFNHEQRISKILKKQSIRGSLIKWLQQSIQNKSNKVFLQRSIANLYLQDIKQSQDQLNQFMKTQGINEFINIYIKVQCRLYQKQGRFNQGLNMITKQIQKLQKGYQQQNYQIDPYIYHLKGNFLMHHLKFQMAIKQFQKSNKLFTLKYHSPEFMRGFKFSKYNIGLCYQKLGKFEQAVKVYKQILEISGQDVQILNALGNAYIQLSQQSQQQIDMNSLKKGIFYLQQAIQLRPDYYISYYNLGYGYLKLNQLQKAIQYFEISLKIKTTSQATYGLMTVHLLRHDYQKVNELISENLKIQQSIQDILSLYYSYSDINNKKSKQFYDDFIIKYHQKIKSSQAFYWVGMIEIKKQNYYQAIRSFQTANDLGYNQAHLYFNLGYSYENVKQYEQAIVEYNKAHAKQYRKETKQRIEYCKNQIKKIKNQIKNNENNNNSNTQL